MAERDTYGVMEGGGSYNLHAKVPAGGAALAMPYLEEAIQGVELHGSQPVVVADYGSSQGKNSLAPMGAAIRGLRARIGAERPILVIHVDQAANDFNILFGVLNSDPERYTIGDTNVFPGAIGRSFYEQVFPAGYVFLGWSCYAAVWLSRIPMTIPGHIVALAASPEVRAHFDRQAAEDWERFVALRAEELRPDGRMVVVLPGQKDEGGSGFEGMFQNANEVVAEMEAKGLITREERERMVLGVYPRRRSQLLAPFADGGLFRGLKVERCELEALPDAAWVDYERHGNKELLAKQHAAFFRAIFVPSLASALTNGSQKEKFADEVERRLAGKLAERPVPIHSFTQTMVMAKSG